MTPGSYACALLGELGLAATAARRLRYTRGIPAVGGVRRPVPDRGTARSATALPRAAGELRTGRLAGTGRTECGRPGPCVSRLPAAGRTRGDARPAAPGRDISRGRLSPARLRRWTTRAEPPPRGRLAAAAGLAGSVPPMIGTTVAQALRDRACAPMVARARLLGLAAAQSAATDGRCAIGSRRHAWLPRQSHHVARHWSSISPRCGPAPLCTQLLGQMGARVIKVESTARPDGARAGSAQFFDLLNANKQSVALDLASASGRRQLRATAGVCRHCHRIGAAAGAGADGYSGG